MRCAWVGLIVVSSAVAVGQGAPKPQVWQMQESGTTAGLRGIDSVDGTVAWASGTGGTVLRTVDGGAHWTKCAVPDGDKDGGTLDFRGVQAWDAKTAIVMASGPGEKSRLYKTVDGCGTWKLVAKNEDKDGFWDAIRAVLSQDRKSIIASIAGDPVRGSFTLFILNISLSAEESQLVALPSDLCELQKSRQLPLPIDPCLRSLFDRWAKAESTGLAGGAAQAKRFEQSRLKAAANPAPLEGEALFAASNSSIANHSDSWFSPDIAFVTGGPSGARFLHYRGWPCAGLGCIYWRVTNIPLAVGDSAGAFSIAVKADRYGSWLGVVVGGDYRKPDSAIGNSAFSKDEGETWNRSMTPPHGYRSTVQWSESLKVWITAGTNGSDVSRDDGRTWTPLDDGNWNALSLPFVVGPGGRIGRLNEGPLP